MLVPLYGFLKGDSLGLLVLVHDHEVVAKIASSLMEAASIRVAPKSNARVYWKGRLLDPELTIAQSGLTALERVDVVQEDRNAL
jgi:hypothetical protein